MNHKLFIVFLLSIASFAKAQIAGAKRNQSEILGVTAQELQSIDKEVISKMQENIPGTLNILNKIIAFTSEPDIFLGIFNSVIYPQYIKPNLKADVASPVQDIVTFMNQNKALVGMMLKGVNEIATHFKNELAEFSVAQSAEAAQARINKALEAAKQAAEKQAGYKPLITPQDLALDDAAFVNRLKEVFKVELNELLSDPVKQSAEAVGKDAEYKRTLVCLLSLKWVLQNEYEKFTVGQNPAVKLTPEQFAQMRAYTLRILPTQQAIDAMFWFLANNDMGKDEIIEQAVNEGRREPITDHDMILTEILKNYEKYKHFIPTWGQLDPHYKKLILESLSADFNYGQFLQAENLPGNLQGLAKLSKEALEFFIVHAIYDIAGAAGWLAPLDAIYSKGSITLGKPAFTSMTLANEALTEEVRAGESVADIYDTYLAKQARRLGFNIDTPENRAVMRLALMTRAGSNADVERIKTIFSSFDVITRKQFVEFLNKKGISDTAVLLYYGPALLQNAMATSTTQEGKAAALKKALEIMFSIFNIITKRSLPIGVYTLDVGPIARAIKKDPNLFNQLNVREMHYQTTDHSHTASEIALR